MNFLANLSYQDNINEEKDTLGGSFSIPESDIYPATIKHAYLHTAKSGANAVVFEFGLHDGQNHRETLYVTNRLGQNFYEKNGQRSYLPSFTNADAIALFATGKPLAEQKTQAKVINVYNAELQKEVPTEVPMLVELLDKQVKLGIIKEKAFKQQVNTATGNYENTDEIRESASINKVFSIKDNRTVPEVRAEKPQAEFYQAWLEKWQGKINDKTLTTKPATKQAAAAPKKSGLFG